MRIATTVITGYRYPVTFGRLWTVPSKGPSVGNFVFPVSIKRSFYKNVLLHILLQCNLHDISMMPETAVDHCRSFREPEPATSCGIPVQSR